LSAAASWIASQPRNLYNCVKFTASLIVERMIPNNRVVPL
jgi:hypothetical protein